MPPRPPCAVVAGDGEGAGGEQQADDIGQSVAARLRRSMAAADGASSAAPLPVPEAHPLAVGNRGKARVRAGVRAARLAGAQAPLMPSALAPSTLEGFNKLSIDEDASSVMDLDPMAQEQPMEQEYVPSTAWLEWTGSLPSCTEDGMHVVWPWERGHAAAISGQMARSSTRPLRRRHRLDSFVDMYLDMASSDGRRGRTHTGVKAWFTFCEDVMRTPGDRPLDPNAPLWVRLEEEWLAMRFVCALVEERGLSVRSAANYFSAVQGWHAREHGVKLAGGLKLEKLPQMLKGLRRAKGETARAIRRGISPAMLRLAMDKLLDPADALHANIRAALCTALQGLLRSQEFSVVSGSSRGSSLVPSRSDLVELSSERMVLMMAPCKNMHHLGGKTCPLVIGAGGEQVDAVAEVANLLRVDPAPRDSSKETPLFRNPYTGKALKYEEIAEWTRKLMAAIGENPSQFGTHSYRIGGATALFSAGANETVIRTMGRWSSDIHRLYVRACFEDCCEWTRLAGSSSSKDVASGEFDEVDYY